MTHDSGDDVCRGIRIPHQSEDSKFLSREQIKSTHEGSDATNCLFRASTEALKSEIAWCQNLTITSFIVTITSFIVQLHSVEDPFHLL